MRTKPKYTQMRIIHENSDGEQTLLYCNDVTQSKSIEAVFGAPIAGSAARYITDTVCEIKLHDKIIKGEDVTRVTSLPEIKQSANNHSAMRGYYDRTDKVFETS